jgi:hypothetical protein
MDGRETRPALTVSFRLERGGQFESGFQKLEEQKENWFTHLFRETKQK